MLNESRPPDDSDALTIPVFSWGGVFSPLLTVPMLLQTGVILFAPADCLDRSELARFFVQEVQHLVPAVNTTHPSNEDYPQLAVLAHSCSVVLLAWLTLVWFVQSMVQYGTFLRYRLACGRLPIKTHLIAPFGAVFFPFLWSTAIGLDGSDLADSSVPSRLFFAVIHVGLTYIASMAVGLQVVSLRLFISTHILRGEGARV